MEMVSLESSSDDEDTYLNSVAKLKALKNQGNWQEEKAAREKVEEIDQEATNAPVGSMVTRSQSRGERGRKKGTGTQVPKQRRKQKRKTADHDSDLEIVSVEENVVDSREKPAVKETDAADVIVLNETDGEFTEEEDYDINIKIQWRSGKIHRLNIQKKESFQKIFEYFANLEGVPINDILITKGDRTVKRSDTPATIHLSVIDILDGGIVMRSKTNSSSSREIEDSEVEENACVIKVQTTGKKTLTRALRRNEKIESLVDECARHFNVDPSKVKLFFDGDVVSPNETPESLDIEDAACFDLRLSS